MFIRYALAELKIDELKLLRCRSRTEAEALLYFAHRPRGIHREAQQTDQDGISIQSSINVDRHTNPYFGKPHSVLGWSTCDALLQAETP